MIFLVARTETPRAPTPVSMYLNMRNFTLSWVSIRAEMRMFLAFSVLLSRRFLARSRASGEAASRSMSPPERRPEGAESWEQEGWMKQILRNNWNTINVNNYHVSRLTTAGADI